MTRSTTIGGISLILAAITLFAAINVRSDHSQDDMAAQFADVEAARTPELVATGLFVLGTILIVPAAIGIATMARERGGRLAVIGAHLLMLGGIWFATGRAFSTHLLYVVTAPGLDRQTRLDAYVHATSSGSFAFFVVFLLCFLVAPVVLGLGLWKMRLAPVWIAPAWVASLASFLAVEGDDLGEFVGFGLMTLVLSWIGVSVIRANEREPRNVVSTTPLEPEAQLT